MGHEMMLPSSALAGLTPEQRAHALEERARMLEEHAPDPEDVHRRRPPLTEDEIREGVAAARRYLERATPEMAVETQRLIVALASENERLIVALADVRSELTRYHPDIADACEVISAAIGDATARR